MKDQKETKREQGLEVIPKLDKEKEVTDKQGEHLYVVKILKE